MCVAHKLNTLTVILTRVKIIAIVILNNNEQYFHFVSYLYKHSNLYNLFSTKDVKP